MQFGRLSLLFTLLLFSLSLFAIPAFAQNGSHIDVDHHDTYGELDEEADASEESPAAESTESGEEVIRIEHTRPSWTGILARNTLAGGITGGLIGIGIWLLTDMSISAMNIAQIAGGGILIGAAIGVVELLARPDIYALDSPNSLIWVQQEAPRTLMIPILKVDFP